MSPGVLLAEQMWELLPALIVAWAILKVAKELKL